MAGLTRQDLHQRLPADHEDREFRDLIEAYNTMLARLEAAFGQASRFSADAAHELRTPLTILQGRIEQAVQQSDRRAIQADLTQMLDEVARLSAITRKLLLLSRADAGHLSLHRTPVDLSALLDDLADDARMLAPDRALQCQVAPGLAVDADEVLLRQLLNNLFSNAVRHGLAGGWIRVHAQRAGASVEVCVANGCAPLDGAERARLFDRFHRGAEARVRHADGQGLGLSLAREIALAHDGTLTLADSPADEVHLRLVLPVSGR